MSKKILLISDTHGSLPAQLGKYAADCDEIWHAGDFGNYEIISTLQLMQPIRGVFGNIDGLQVKSIFPENLLFEIEGIKILLTHIGGNPNKLPSRVKSLLVEHKPKIFICGHSHIARVETLHQFNNCVYINPGAAGNEGFHQQKTLMLLTLKEGKLESLQLVELGQRGINSNLQDERLLI